jgi:hypothetical protein
MSDHREVDAMSTDIEARLSELTLELMENAQAAGLEPHDFLSALTLNLTAEAIKLCVSTDAVERKFYHQLIDKLWDEMEKKK